MLKCNECAVELGDFKKTPSPRIRWFWLESDAWRTRLVFCTSCTPNDATIQKLILKGSVKKWGLPNPENARWGEEVTLHQFCLIASNGICAKCNFPLESESLRDGWRMFHPNCRGVVEGRLKPKVA